MTRSRLRRLADSILTRIARAEIWLVRTGIDHALTVFAVGGSAALTVAWVVWLIVTGSVWNPSTHWAYWVGFATGGALGLVALTPDRVGASFRFIRAGALRIAARLLFAAGVGLERFADWLQPRAGSVALVIVAGWFAGVGYVIAAGLIGLPVPVWLAVPLGVGFGAFLAGRSRRV